ncbi:MAG: flagellar protein FlgN [Firmicutes bacterium]|nr:flagellar protein FlgN [Bacillota bacterium]HXL04322.1 flagellar protein FlgN [Bacillota bacterium]
MEKRDRDFEEQCDLLLNLLEREIDLYNDLISFSKRKQGALIIMDAKDLADALSDVEAVVDEIRESVEARLNILAELESSMGLPRGTATFKHVVDNGGPELQERYGRITKALAPTLERLVLLNGGNMALVNNILDYFDFAAQTLACRDQVNTYTVRKGGRPDVFHISRA